MSEAKDGGPAFPQTIDDMGTMRVVTCGMTLRDYFAGQALAGLGHAITSGTLIVLGHKTVSISELCYVLADTMLAQRVKAVENQETL